jgi:hypothetical protein
MTAVPQPLLTFLLLCAAGCLWAAGRTAAPGPTLGSSGATAGWWSVAGGAAAVSVAADLSLASWAGTGLPGDLAVRAAVCVLPVLLAGALVPRTRAGRLRAALGTGVVTVPMTALGWALFASPAASPAGPADVLALTLLTGVAPFALAVALVVRTARR